MTTYINSIDRTTSSALIADRLRRDIILGKYAEGHLLNELSLSEALKESRASVRTALIELEREGLVSTLKNGRKMLGEFSDRTICDVNHVRAVLECEAAELALKQKVLDCTKMMQCIHEFELLLAEKNVEKIVEERVRNDSIFHRAIMEQSGNRYLLQCWSSQEPIYTTLRSLQAKIIQPEAQNSEYTEKHRRIMEMFLNRDPSVTEYLNEHISGSTSMLIQNIKILSESEHLDSKEAKTCTDSENL